MVEPYPVKTVLTPITPTDLYDVGFILIFIFKKSNF